MSAENLVSIALPGRPPIARRAWVAAAHLDDITSTFGGTLELLRAGGCSVTIADPGNYPGEYGEPLIAAIVAAVEAARADLVIAPSPLEPDPARRVWGMASVEAVRRIGAPLRLALYERDRPGRADHLVDVSDTQAASRERAESDLALARFRARQLPGARLVEAFEVWSADDLVAGLPSLYVSEHRRHAIGGKPVDGARDLPLVSVLVRSMQRECLAEALDSIALQTWPNVEVLVINARGGRHPEPGPRCGRFALRLLNQDGARLPRPAAANLGLASARGDWLLFLDDDDLLDPDHVARLRAALAADPGAHVAYGGVRLVDAAGERVGRLDEPFDSGRLWLANYLPIHAVMFSRKAIDAGVRFDESLPVYEDWDFWRQLSLEHRFVHVPGVSATYRLVGDSGLSAHADEGTAAEGRERFYRKWLPRMSSADLERLARSGERYRIAAQELGERSRRAESELTSMSERYRVAAQQLAELHAALAASQAARQELERQAAALVESLTAQASALGAERAAHEATRAEARQQADALAAQVAAYRDQLVADRDHYVGLLDATRADYERLDQGYRQVTGSLSWRVTAPLRRLRGLAGEGGGGKLLRWAVRALPISSAVRHRVAVRIASTAVGSRLLRRVGVATGAPRVAPAAAPGAFDKEAVRADAESRLGAFLAGSQRVSLRGSGQGPLVSVVVVLYNQAGLSLLCLQALEASHGVNYETLIVDNASSDRVGELLDRIDGATVLRQRENIGFLRAVNLAAAHARGEYLLLLNNDAVVEPETIANAVARLGSDHEAGAVGGPILLWDGLLQEAGSIIWRDGSCQGYGRGESPDLPPYRFVRDVDYCSGAFLMIRRALFERLGRFDDAFAPAYYEESDFCVRLWEAGHRVVYDPRVRVKHFEFASDVDGTAAMALQARNRERFVDKHRAYLSRRPERSPEAVVAARQIVREGWRRVLVIDDRIPYPGLGRGYPRAALLAQALASRAATLTYYPLVFSDGDWNLVYEVLDPRTEVVLDHGIAGLADFLASRAGTFDLMLVSRPHNMRVVEALRSRQPRWFADCRMVYDAEAVFALREIEKARILGRPMSEAQARSLLDEELALAANADRIVAVSEDEADQYRRAGCKDVIVLGHALMPQPTPASFADRRGFLFVGAISEDGCPNGDSLWWFATEVWPEVSRQLGPDAILDVVGVCESERVRALASDTIRIHGRVDELTPYFDARRVFVVPTRFAAGLPHKAHEAASRGLPMVVSPLIARQLGWREQVLVGTDAASFAAACVRLHRERELWQSVRASALTAVEHDCSQAAFEAAVDLILA